MVYIWRWNRTAGYWHMVRDSFPENTARWLEIFRGDQPGEIFKAAKKRPKAAPREARQ